jgi:peptide-methionine (R)-S-oxide reductase
MSYKVQKTDEEWKKILTPEQFEITRMKHTESPFSGEYCDYHEPGKYACVCCDTLLFDSSTKFESGTGWPSFTEPVEKDLIEYVEDTKFGMLRTEVLCSTCGAHLGHVFPDGPPPSGKRYCINSIAIKHVE